MEFLTILTHQQGLHFLLLLYAAPAGRSYLGNVV